MTKYRKNRISFLILLIATMFSFAFQNVKPVYATGVSGYDAEQELIRQKKKNTSNKSTKKEKKSANKETLVVNNASDEY